MTAISISRNRDAAAPIAPSERMSLPTDQKMLNHDDWRSDTQPFYARASFTKMCLPAFLYSIISNGLLRLLSYVPFNSLLRINPSTLHSEDCFMTSELSLPPIAIITGSNTGVGFETAKGLVQRGYHVILACRSRQKGLDAAEKINKHFVACSGEGVDSKNMVGKASFLKPLDLASFASIRSFCEAFSEKYDSLNILVNNAGINSQGDITEDGLEICFQSNFVGHFLLTKLLIPCLLNAKNTYKSNEFKDEAGRIVNLSSVTHHFAPSHERAHHTSDVSENNDIHDKHFWLGSATPGVSTATYRESKLASILFTIELNKRYGEKGIRSIAVNPGSVSSDIWRNESAFTKKLYRMVYLTPKQGSSTSIAGSIGNLPIDAIYLQPYWQPIIRRKMHSTNQSFQRNYPLPFPLFEMLGPYVSHSVTVPRLPVDGCGGYKSSGQLWDVCETLISN